MRRLKRYGSVRRRRGVRKFKRSRKAFRRSRKTSSRKRAPRRYRSRFLRKRKGLRRSRKTTGVAWGYSKLGRKGHKRLSASFQRKVLTAIDQMNPVVDLRNQWMNIRDCGLGTQSIYSHTASTYLEMPAPLTDEYLNGIAALTDGKTAYVSHGKFEISSHESATTIYNPMNAAVHIRVEWVTPRVQMPHRMSNARVDAKAQYTDWNENHIGASYLDLPAFGSKWRLFRKPRSMWLQPGASKTFYMKHLRRAIVVNLAEGPYQTLVGGVSSGDLPSVYPGVTKYMLLTVHGPVSQNNMNTETAIAQSSFSNARLVIGTRLRTLFRPLIFTGNNDLGRQAHSYTQGFRTTYSNSGVPLITTKAFNAKLDDDDTRPSGFGTNNAIATGDQRVHTHDS